MDNRNIDFKIMLPGSVGPILVLRKWDDAVPRWCAFFDHEQNNISTYDSLCPTPEEAIQRFIKYRINGEHYESRYSKFVIYEE